MAGKQKRIRRNSIRCWIYVASSWLKSVCKLVGLAHHDIHRLHFRITRWQTQHLSAIRPCQEKPACLWFYSARGASYETKCKETSQPHCLSSPLLLASHEATNTGICWKAGKPCVKEHSTIQQLVLTSRSLQAPRSSAEKSMGEEPI